MRALNDPSQSKAAGKIRPALMPRGPKATGKRDLRMDPLLRPDARRQGNAARRANAVKFIEFFGGKDTTGPTSSRSC